MRNKVEKKPVSTRGMSKLSGIKKNKDMGKASQLSQTKRTARKTPNVKSQGVCKKKKTASTKSNLHASKNDDPSDSVAKAPVKVKPPNTGRKESDKPFGESKKVKGARKKIVKAIGKMPKESPAKSKLKSKKQSETKTKSKSKTKESSQKNVNQFIDIWSLVSIGKREASLNASMKVNIMYEKQVSPKKSSPAKSLPSNSKTTSDSKGSGKESPNTSNKTHASSTLKTKPCGGKERSKKVRSLSSPKKSVVKKSESPDKKCTKKRKCQYKIYEDEPKAKTKKKDNDKRTSKAKSKKVVKKRKKSVLGHNLGNIIERSPRQASLNAKAMIAMEQEDDTPVETAARTKVYDWTEVRSTVANGMRKMTWVTGSGDMKILAQSKRVRKNSVNNDSSVSMTDIVNSTEIKDNDSYLLHNTLLKAIHEIGDPRLLKEFVRSQKEDYQGDIDIERCPTPEPPPPPPEPVKESSTPSPKKKTPKCNEVKKSPEKQMKKPSVPSPTNSKPCRVATPIPQFSPGQQRPSHITGFVHHPTTHTQPIFSNVGDQQHQKQPPPPPPQPIKVTPYAPSSAYMYQCPPADRQQQNIFVSNTPSPMPPFGNAANNLVQRNFPATFTFNQMGSLSFERRGLNPYQHHQGNAYPPSMHLPIQPLGFNFQQFYQPSIQQLHNQQNLPQSIQPVPVPAHQQYALVPPPHQLPPSVIQQSQPLPPAHINSIRSFQQSSYPPYSTSASPASSEVKQDKPCMPPPPPCPVSQSLQQQQSPMTSIVQPLPSYRRAIPVRPQVQSHNKLIKPSPERLSTIGIANSSCSIASTMSPSVSSHRFHNSQQSQPQQTFKPVCTGSVIIHNPLPIRPIATVNASFRPIICKKETKIVPQNCDKSSAPVTSAESSMSDILHSAHSTMFSVEEKGTNDSPNKNKLRNPSVATTISTPTTKETILTNVIAKSKNTENFNGSYSVTSILEMPSCKIKSEPNTKSCAVNTSKSSSSDQKNKVAKKEMYYLCIPPPKGSGKPGTSLLTTAIPIKDSFPFKLPENLGMGQFPNSKQVIVIDDSEDSSDDEPLAKLVQSKPNEAPISKTIIVPDKTKNSSGEAKKIKQVKNKPKALKVKLFEKKLDMKEAELKDIKTKTNTKQCKNIKQSKKVLVQLKNKQFDKNEPTLKMKSKQTKDEKSTSTQLKSKQFKVKNQKLKKVKDLDSSPDKVMVTTKECDKKDNKAEASNESVADSCGDKSDGVIIPSTKKPGPKVMKKAPVRRKSKTQTLIPPVLPKTKAIHGWSWIGEGELKMIPKLTQLKEESVRLRKCYKSMKHTFGEVISVRDCVILQSDGDGSVPYVGKVSALWENINGDMMFSMLWYYQPEHTAAGREPEDGESELFASKHREENSVACIDDKCYVLMYNEFCRMEADATRQELGVPTPSSHQVIPPLSKEDRSFLRPLPPTDVGMDNIWFCRYDYDTRKKIVRKPKHKKTDLRYRGPCKLVQQ